MKNFYKYIVLMLLTASAVTLVAQEEASKTYRDYSVLVVNSTGSPLQGVAVFATKSGRKGLTNAQGSFSIRIQEDEGIMLLLDAYDMYSYVVKKDKPADTVMMSIVGKVSELQPFSISQGVMPFERITGSVERITGEELMDFSTPYLAEALAGRLSGLSTKQFSASPIGESFFTSIRGGGGEVYVDGALSGITETAAEINEVIIAKDYGSAFMYGTTATDGAIIINSKRGESGQKTVDFGVRTGVRNPTFVSDMMSGEQYAKAYNQALISNGSAPIYSETVKNVDPVANPDNDYYKDLYSLPSKYVHATIDLSGGNDVANYFSHVGYYNTNGNESVGDGSELTRLRTKNNVDFNIADYAKVTVGIGASFEMTSGPSLQADDLFKLRSETPANAFPYMINDSVYGKSSIYSANPYASLTHGSVYKRTDRDVYSRLGLDLDLSEITEGLSLSGLYNIYVFNALRQDLNPSVDMAEPYIIADAHGNDSLELRNYTFGQDDQDWERSVDYVLRNQHITAALRYIKDFSSTQSLISSINYNYRKESGSQLQVDDIRRNIGVSANYMVDKKYVFEANVQNSVIRQMSEAQRNRLSYDGGAAWLLHKEAFIDASWLDLLKLRANYGLQLQPVSQFFLYDDLYVSSGAGNFGTSTSSSSAGYIRSFTANADIKIPSKTYLNIGADYMMFKGKVSGQVNYFKQEISDAIVIPDALYSLISSNQAYLPLMNYGASSTTGFDARVKYRNTVNDFRYSIDGNMTYYTTYVSQSNSVNYPEQVRNVTGNNGRRILGLEAVGIFQSKEEIAAALPQNFGSEVKVGDVRYADSNNDKVIDEKDFHEIGKYSPIYYGLNLSLGYKGFTLSAHADGQLGGSILDKRLRSLSTQNYPTDANAAGNPRISPAGEDYNNSQISTNHLLSATYFNLRNVNLRYQLPQSILQRVPVKTASLRLSAKNLLVLSANNDKVYMPSASAGYTTAPVLNAYELGLDIKF